jgi:hypothetical protein
LAKGFLEIRISYGTLANFGYTISPKDTDNDTKIANVAKIVKDKIKKTLQSEGVGFDPIENTKTFQIKFNTTEKYESIIVTVVEKVIELLEDNREF